VQKPCFFLFPVVSGVLLTIFSAKTASATAQQLRQAPTFVAACYFVLFHVEQLRPKYFLEIFEVAVSLPGLRLLSPLCFLRRPIEVHFGGKDLLFRPWSAIGKSCFKCAKEQIFFAREQKLSICRSK